MINVCCKSFKYLAWSMNLAIRWISYHLTWPAADTYTQANHPGSALQLRRIVPCGEQFISLRGDISCRCDEIHKERPFLSNDTPRAFLRWGSCTESWCGCRQKTGSPTTTAQESQTLCFSGVKALKLSYCSDEWKLFDNIIVLILL